MERVLIYQGGVTHEGVSNLQTLALTALHEGVETLTLFICSRGGDVTSGIGAYNFLQALPIKVQTHAMGSVGSIAATMFLAGEVRTATPASMITLHAATYADGPRTGEVSESTALIALPFREQLGWSDEMVERYFGSASESYLTPQLAMEHGILTGVQPLQLPKEPGSAVKVRVF